MRQQLTLAAQGINMLGGVRSLVRDPVRLDDVESEVARDWRARDTRFLEVLDTLVWPIPDSPYRALLDAAGVERGDVAALVGAGGVEHALAALRDAGVYVSYEEWKGDAPARRGSASFEFTPASFFNPVAGSDYTSRTGGTRSGGTAVAANFANLKRRTRFVALQLRSIGARPDTPVALWLPVLPSMTGVSGMLVLNAAGLRPERWFSQLPVDVETSRRKRIANRALPHAVRWLGGHVPTPIHAPSAEPGAVLDWCAGATARGLAALGTYPSSAVRLAAMAAHRGVRLDGLYVWTVGEPLTDAKRAAIEASGATVMNLYGAMQSGSLAVSCRYTNDESLHVLEHDVAVVQRRRPRHDGVPVDAYLWTTLRADAPNVLLNAEVDDYGRLTVDDEPCRCVFGGIGFRHRVAEVRGISKIVAEGVTVYGDVLTRLVETELPRRFGGSPGDYQFGEEERDGATRLALRVDPLVPNVDVAGLTSYLRDALRGDDRGLLADEVWRGTGALTIVREPPRQAPSGKTLAFEPLGAAVPGSP